MTNDDQLRNDWRRYKCSPDQLEKVVIAGRKLEVAPPTIDSWNALSTVLGKHGYVVRKDDTGSYNCRNIGDTNTPSLHSYGIAVDINWNTNPYKKTPDRRKVRYSAAATQAARAAEVHAGIADTDMTRDMINDVLAIKTTRGERVFDWGGRWEKIKDTMHFELDLGPEELAAGIEWSSVAGHVGPANVAPPPASPASAESPQPGASNVYRVTSRNGLRLRAGNGTDFEVLRVLAFDSIVQEVKRDGQWSIVDLTGDGAADGSVHNAFLEPAGVATLRFADANSIHHAQRADGTAAPQQPVSEFIFLNTRHTATDLQEDPSLDVRLDTSHKPRKGWKVTAKPNGYVLTADDYPAPIHVGKRASYHYGSRGLTTAGLGRTSYDGTPGHIKYDPADWNAEFNHWPELIFPTAYAESGADFSVVNAWDLAGMTFGFIQLAAHTADDLIPLFRRLIADLPEEAERFFPELILVDGKICYRKGGGYRRLEVHAPALDPVPNDLVDRGLFVGFFNRDRQRLDDEEVQAAARWLAWTQESEAMRRIQVAASIDNMRDSLDILHRALLHGASSRYPKGVDGMRCDYLAAALAVPHLNPRRVDKAVWALCRPDILHAFKQEIEYGPGDREKTVVEGVLKRGPRLSDMHYDFVNGHPA